MPTPGKSVDNHSLVSAAVASKNGALCRLHGSYLAGRHRNINQQARLVDTS